MEGSFDEAVDAWSLGCLLVRMSTPSPLYANELEQADWPAVCLQLDADPHSPAADAQWRIADSAATNVIAHGTAAGVSLAAWHRLELAFTAGNVSASLDGKPLGGGALGPPSATTGMVELQSGWHVAEFDNFALVSK